MTTSSPTDHRLDEDTVPDEVVLLDEAARPLGTAPRATVHDRDTPLHLAFSCYLFDPAGRLLLTRRAVTKRTWPGVWTNSFCGHPRPGEEVEAALHRYAAHELGLAVDRVAPLLPEFRYRAVDPSGVVENEVCPVFAAHTVELPRPHPDEVAEHRWVDLAELHDLADRAPWVLSPWLVSQVEQVRASAAGWDPAGLPTGSVR